MCRGSLNPEKKDKGKEKENKQAVDPNVREAEVRLTQKLGMKVHIEDKGGRGRVIIEYAKLDDFEKRVWESAGTVIREGKSPRITICRDRTAHSTK